MSNLLPINFKNWIDKNRHLLKPPVGNKVIYNEGDFIIMVVGGPNSRKDFHVDSKEEFFFQVEGDMLLEVFEAGKRKKYLLEKENYSCYQRMCPTLLRGLRIQ